MLRALLDSFHLYAIMVVKEFPAKAVSSVNDSDDVGKASEQGVDIKGNGVMEEQKREQEEGPRPKGKGKRKGEEGEAKVAGSVSGGSHTRRRRRPPVLMPAKGSEVIRTMEVTDLVLAELMKYKVWFTAIRVLVFCFVSLCCCLDLCCITALRLSRPPSAAKWYGRLAPFYPGDAYVPLQGVCSHGPIPH